jgi:ribosome-associated translation inhibitor RaiA
MQVLLNTDSHIEGNSRLASHVEQLVQNALDRFGNRIMRVVVTLTDRNSDKKSGAHDKRCVMEARLAGLQPVSVTSAEESVDLALDTAIAKLEKTVAKTFDKLSDVKGQRSHAGEQRSISEE